MSTPKLFGNAASIVLFGAVFFTGVLALNSSVVNKFDGIVFAVSVPALDRLAFPLLAKGPASGKTDGAGASQPPSGSGAQSADKKKSEGVKSQTEKKLEEQPKDLIRNWGG